MEPVLTFVALFLLRPEDNECVRELDTMSLPFFTFGPVNFDINLCFVATFLLGEQRCCTTKRFK